MSIPQLNNPEYYSSTSKKTIDLIIGFFIGLVVNAVVLKEIMNFISLSDFAINFILYYSLIILLIIDELLVFLLFHFKRKYFGIGYVILLLLLAIVSPILLGNLFIF